MSYWNMLFYFWKNRRNWLSVHLCWCPSVPTGGGGLWGSGHAGLEGPGCCKLHCVTCGLSSGHHLSAMLPSLNWPFFLISHLFENYHQSKARSLKMQKSAKKRGSCASPPHEGPTLPFCALLLSVVSSTGNLVLARFLKQGVTSGLSPVVLQSCQAAGSIWAILHPHGYYPAFSI